MTKKPSDKRRASPRIGSPPADKRLPRELIDEQRKSAQNTEGQSAAGLPRSGMDRALEIARDAVDAHTMGALRNSLDAFISGPKAHTLTRPNIIALLRCLSEGLNPSTEKTVAVVKTVEILVTSHPAIVLLNDFIQILEDLNKGKIHRAVKPSIGGADATKVSKRPPKHIQSDRFLAEYARKAANLIRDIEITEGMLKTLVRSPRNP